MYGMMMRGRTAPIVRKPILKQTSRLKMFRSKNYNYTFDLRSGHFLRYADKPGVQPTWSPFGPETLEIEVSAGASCPVTCAGCYKSGNGERGDAPKNMSFENFSRILEKLPYIVSKNKRMYFLTQINFGITSVSESRELFQMFDLCREYGIIPNISINAADILTDNEVQRIADTCGQVSISIGLAYCDAGLVLVKRFIKARVNKIHINYVLSVQSIDFLYTFLEMLKEDDELKMLDTITFQGLKPTGRGEHYDILPGGEYIRLLKYALAKRIKCRWDTCSAPRFEKAILFLELPPSQKAELMAQSERCTAGLFSGYIDVTGRYWHCPFGEGKAKAGYFNLNDIDDFHQAVWLSEPMKEWRKSVNALDRECALFENIHSNK